MLASYVPGLVPKTLSKLVGALDVGSSGEGDIFSRGSIDEIFLTRVSLFESHGSGSMTSLADVVNGTWACLVAIWRKLANTTAIDRANLVDRYLLHVVIISFDPSRCLVF